MNEVAGPLRIDEIPLGDPRMKEFVAFHWKLYEGNKYWVPQFDADLLGNRLLGLTGLLTPQHPYHKSSIATHFLALRGKDTVGRISVVVNNRFNEYYDVRVAFFGFFECVEEYAVAEALLDAARAWATRHGATVLCGPGEYCNITHERQGCLIDGFDQDVYVEHTWNPPYYREFIERYGFEKAMDYHAYIIDLTQPINDRLDKIADRVRQRGHLELRPVDMSRFDEEVKLVIDIYNQAWAQNWGFLPITEWEVDALVEALKPIIDPGLCRFAYYKGEPIAVLGAFPDPNLRPPGRAGSSTATAITPASRGCSPHVAQSLEYGSSSSASCPVSGGSAPTRCSSRRYTATRSPRGTRPWTSRCCSR